MKALSAAFMLMLATAVALSFELRGGRVNPSISQADGARRISPNDLQQLIKKGEAVIVDVRSAEVYKAGHIKGARSIPAGEIAARAGELPQDKLIATYCS